MELGLKLVSNEQVSVTVDGQESHTFALTDILPERKNQQEDVFVLDAPVKTGRRLFDALFRAGTKAQGSLGASPKRILLVTSDKVLDAIPWEYLYGPEGYLVLDYDFLRGLPDDQRQPAPDLQGTSLHIVAVPSNPISNQITPLDIDGEWRKLREGIESLDSAIVLERTRPPTLEQTRRLIANQHHRVLHFMGHGGSTDQQAVLLFEDERGASKAVTAQDFVRRLEDSTFLVVLNSCEGATAGETEFSNLAHVLVVRKIPYAIGMRFSIHDENAKEFSRAFYDELTRGVPVESALRHTRQVLADSKIPWAVGIPVLYTSLQAPAGGFVRVAGTPLVDEHQPPLEVIILDKAKGAFQGRVDELLALGKGLTGEPRVKVRTIHGAGGQGKTALAREAAERFAYAFPGGVFAISLETKPSRADFCFQLAKFLKLPTDQFVEQGDLERAILSRLQQQRTLLVLDNAETFTEAVRDKNKDALDLAEFLRERLLGTLSILLVTSREPLGFPGEQVLLLEGLSPREGAALFIQSASQRAKDIKMAQAESLSRRLDGHPLALLLLGLAFNEIEVTLEQFVTEHETRLMEAEDRYRAVEHRHRTLYASIETSTRYLDEDHKKLLSGLWIFHAPFLPNNAARILMDAHSPKEEEQVYQQLHTLFRRGLLVQEFSTLKEGNIRLYRSLPTLRLFSQQYISQSFSADTLQVKMSKEYEMLLKRIYDELDKGQWASYLVSRCREDLERCAEWLHGINQGRYELRLGWVLYRIGYWRTALGWLEKGLEIAQDQDQDLEVDILNAMAGIYQSTGQPGKALELYQQALLSSKEMHNHTSEVTILNNMAGVYYEIGQPHKALELYQLVLPSFSRAGDRNAESTTLSNMAAVYQEIGQPSKVLELCKQALPIVREVGNRNGEAITLDTMAGAYQAIGQPHTALELYRQALPIFSEVGNRRGESTTLQAIGLVYRALGQPVKALELYQQALPIRREVGDRSGEASTLNEIALVHLDIGQPHKALELYQEALPIMQEVSNRHGEADTLNKMGMVYQSTGQPQKALEFYQRALPIWHEVSNRNGEATTLNNMGLIYRAIGQPGKALELYEQALPIWREVSNRMGEADTLNNMGTLYQSIGQPQKALEILKEVLFIRQAVSDRKGEASALNNIGLVYQGIAQPDKALEFFKRALPIMQEVVNRSGEATTLNNMATVYQGLQQLDKALDLFQKTLPIIREIRNPYGEAVTLNNMGMISLSTGQVGKALELFQQALPIMRAVGDRNGEATTLNNMAAAYQESTQLNKAFELYQQVLLIMQEISNRNGEATTLNNMGMICLSTGKSDEALELLGKALPILQEVGDRNGEAIICFNIALLYRTLKRDVQAVQFLRQAALLEKQIASLNYLRTAVLLFQWETALQHSQPLPSEHSYEIVYDFEILRRIVAATINVMTGIPEARLKWREMVSDQFRQDLTKDMQNEHQFLDALLDILDGKKPVLLENNPYEAAVQFILQAISRSQPDP